MAIIQTIKNGKNGELKMKQLKFKKMSNMTWQKYRVQLETEVSAILLTYRQTTGNETLYCYYHNSLEGFLTELPESELKTTLQSYLPNAKVLIEIRKVIDAKQEADLEQKREELRKKDEEKKKKTTFKGVHVSSLSLIRYLWTLPEYEPKEGDQVACLIGHGEKLHSGSITRLESGELGVRCYRRNYNWGRGIPVCLWENAKPEFISETL